MNPPRPRRTLNGKRAALLLGALCLFGGAVYAANRSMVRANASALLQQAKKAEEDGNSKEALKLYVDYLNFQPKDVDALAGYAQLLENAGRGPKVARLRADTYERLLRIEPNRRDDRVKLAKLYLEMPFYSAAKDHVEYLLDPSRGGTPDDPELLTSAAYCELGTGRPKEAVERLREAVRTKRASNDAYIYLAHLLRAEIKTAEAIEESDRVLAQLIKDKPGDLTARLARCRYLTSLGKYDAARKELAAVRAEIKDVEKNPDLALMIAELEQQDNRPKDAQAILEKTAAVNPKDYRPLMKLVDLFNQMNDFARAKQTVQKASALMPEHGNALLDAIDRKIDFGMYAEAKQDVGRYGNRAEYQPAVDYLEGRLLLAEGNWPKARPKLEKAVEHFQRLPRFLSKAWVAIAVCHKAANNPDRMLAAAASAVRADPTSPLARLAQAEAHALLGRWNDAVPVFKQYADRSPDARVAYVRFVFAEQLAKPAAERNWEAFEAAAGAPPYPADVVVLLARSRVIRGQSEGGVDSLREAVKARPDEAGLHANLALVTGLKDVAAGLAALDEAERKVGDKVALRLAKAQLLATDPARADYPAIAAVGENAAGFSRHDRFALYAGLGDIAGVRLAKAAEATEWYRRAAAEDPYHLGVRVAMFRSAIKANQTAHAEQALNEIRELDTPDGATFLLYDAVRQIPGLRSGGREKLPEVRAQVERAMKSRESWPLAHALLGELDELADDPDTALDHYRRSFELGERSDTLVRRMVQLLCQRNRYEEARRVLDTRDRIATLPGDLRRMNDQIAAALGGNPSNAAALQATENSKDPVDHLFRGQTLMLTGDRAGAAKAFEKAVSLNPHLIDGWVSLVRVYVWTGKAVEAEAAATRADRALADAAAKATNKAAIPTALGDVRLMVGKLREAEAQYKQALAAVPADPTATRRLVELYMQTGRPADAAAPLDAVLASPARDAVKRWARRALAESLVARPAGFKSLPAALALFDENLKSGSHVEDERARAFLLARDPFRRPEARQQLLASARKGPFTADEHAALARLSLDEGDAAAAEDHLKQATRTAAVANPDHLRMLHQVQLSRGRLPAARETLDRLMKLGLATWEVAAEEARHLARAGDKPAAAKLLLAFPGAADPTTRLNVVAPFLAEIGCTDEAEKLYKTLVDSTTLPNRHLALALFLASAGKAEQAIDLAKRFDPKDYPPAAKAHVFTTAVVNRPRLSVPERELAAWDRTLAELTAWVADQLRAHPQDRQLRQCEAVLADAQGRYDDAIRSYEQRLAAEPDSTVARNNLALLLALHRKDESNRPLELINAAIDQVGPQGSLLATRAVVHLTADRHAEAIRDLEAAVLLEQRPTYYFHLALAYEKAKNVPRKIVAVDASRDRGLKKAMLHPTEWAEYERLFGPGTQ